jgi:uncharacterized protein (TIGR03437 family)
MKKTLRYGIVVLISAACLSAAPPRLRLENTALGPFSIVVGANGAAQTVGVSNIGGGTFNLTVTSSAQWLTGAYQAATPCSSVGCGKIAITLATSALTAGSYTGILTILDPNAIDVPQTITVTVNVGGAVPAALTLYAPPGGSAPPVSFTAGANARATVPNANWLSVACGGAGSFQFDVSCTINASAKGLSAAAYNGNITVTGSTFAPDNKSIPVTFNVTASPIAAAGTTTSLTFSASTPFGAKAKLYPQDVWIANAGQGTLTVANTKIAVDTGAWLSAVSAPLPGGVVVAVSVDPTGLAAGLHSGTVTVDSNAANSPTVFNVDLDVNGAGAGPTIAWPRILNIGNFALQEPTAEQESSPEAVAPGDIVAVYGADMLEGDAINVTAAPPLPTRVGTDPDSVQVLVNGLAAPIFYASYGQINIQIPFETSVAQDAQVQVVRNGITSPIATVPMAARVPRMLQVNCVYANVCPAPWQPYANGLLFADFPALDRPLPAAYPIPGSRPAKAGDVIEFFAIGLGQASPALVTGAIPPTSPLPAITPPFKVCFASAPLGTAVCTPAQYAGIAPGWVGLYQVNAEIPANAPTGDAIYMTISNGQATSDPVLLAIQ